MKIIHDSKGLAVTIRFENSFGVREAISLPGVVATLPSHARVTLDFRPVQWVTESTLAALIPAIASIHGRHIAVRGLEDTREDLPLAA
jgi:hypothetical protein